MYLILHAYTHTRFRFGSAIVADQPRPIPFLVQSPYNPFCFLAYSNTSTSPQDQEVRTQHINVIHTKSKCVLIETASYSLVLRILIAFLPHLRYPSRSSTTLLKWGQPCTSSTWSSALLLALIVKNPHLQ